MRFQALAARLVRLSPTHAGVAHAGVALAGVALALLPGACSPAYLAPPVSPQLAALSPAAPSLLERGYQVHQAKCANCHPYENPARHPPATLTRKILPEMAHKAKLDPADQQAVLAYLLAARQLPPPPKPQP